MKLTEANFDMWPLSISRNKISEMKPSSQTVSY